MATMIRQRLAHTLPLSRRFLSEGISGLASVERSPTNETISYLGHPDRNVLLIGTAHISRRSAQEVRNTIENFKPDCVMIELCQGRMNKLRQQQHVPDISVEGVMRSLASQGPQGIANMLSKGPMGLAGEMRALMGGLGGGGGGRNDDASGLGSMGAEFLAAIEAAEALRIPVIPGDVPQEEILKGCVNGLFETSLPTLLSKLASGQGMLQDLMQRMQTPAAGMEQYVEQMKTRKKAEEASSTMKDFLPGVHRVLVAGRDEHMVSVLRDLPSHHKTVVAVVGMGHMAGMEEEWKQKMAQHRLR